MKMKNHILNTLLLPALLAGAMSAGAEDLVILHTNDTHSLIDPNAKGEGGVLQRKAIIDSVRRAEKNVLLVDAGDIVQGTLYFNFFKGDVEYPLMNLAKYDVQILGNHEFDNGLEDLARHYKDLKASRLSANYDFTDTPLRGMFEPYVIKKVKGKKIGFIGININPEGLISEQNYEGLKYSDSVEAANRTAEYLKDKKKCDLVVVVSHIGVSRDSGQPIDYDIARASKDIDIIIGGHSHTVIEPGNKGQYPCYVDNAEGRPVLVTQTGKYGRNLGYIKIDLDRLATETPKDYDYQLIKVTDRFPQEQLDPAMKAFIAPYKHVVDSVNNRVIAQSKYDLDSDDRNGGYANWAGDFAAAYARNVADSINAAGGNIPRVDFALMNVGGIRQNMPKGNVTEGQMLATFPFSNHLVIASIKGRDFIDAMKVAAPKGGEAISSELRVVTDGKGGVEHVVIDGREMDPDKDYTYATIDYLFWGNDGMKSLANSKLLWRDDEMVSAPILRYVEEQGRLGIPIAPDLNGRFIRN